MVHTVYRTTNMLDGKFYIGVHKTENPCDDYLGSGTYLKRAIDNHGVHNFKKEVLFEFSKPDEAFQKEFELVEMFRDNPQCYNLRQGGSGGFDYINKSGLNGSQVISDEAVKRRANSWKKRFSSNPTFKRKILECLALGKHCIDPEQREKSRQKATASWKGQSHSLSTRTVMSLNQQGSLNSQYGWRVLHRDGTKKRFAPRDISAALVDGWHVKQALRKTGEIVTPVDTAWCSEHQEFLPMVEFHKYRRSKSGYQNKCKECRKKLRVRTADKGRGAASGGNFSCKEKISRVGFSGAPPKFITEADMTH